MDNYPSFLCWSFHPSAIILEFPFLSKCLGLVKSQTYSSTLQLRYVMGHSPTAAIKPTAVASMQEPIVI